MPSPGPTGNIERAWGENIKYFLHQNIDSSTFPWPLPLWSIARLTSIYRNQPTDPSGRITARSLPWTVHFGLVTTLLQPFILPWGDPSQSETSNYQCYPLLHKTCYTYMASDSPCLEAQKSRFTCNELFTRRLHPITCCGTPNHSWCLPRSHPGSYNWPGLYSSKAHLKNLGNGSPTVMRAWEHITKQPNFEHSYALTLLANIFHKVENHPLRPPQPRIFSDHP